MMKIKLPITLIIAFCGLALTGYTVSAAGEPSDSLPYEVSLILHKAQKFIENKQIPSAIELLETSLTRHSSSYNHYLVHFTLGNCCMMEKHLPEASVHYQACLKLKEDFPEGWLNLAKCFYDSGRFADAGRCFIRAYDTSESGQASTLYYAGLSWLQAKEPGKAADILQKLIDAHDRADQHFDWKEALVQAYIDSGRPRNALPYIEELSEKTTGKKKKQWQEIRLFQYMSLQINDRAKAYAEFLVEEYPLESKWWKILAHMHLTEHNYESGLTTLTVYSFLSPLNDEEMLLMAELNTAVDIPIQAAAWYERLNQKKPDADTTCRLAQCYLSLHDSPKALETVKNAQNRCDSEKLNILEGQILFEMKRYAEAMAAFEFITASHPDQGDAWLMMGYAAFNAEHFQKAKTAFKQASTFKSHRATAKRFLKQLEAIIGREG